MQIYCERETYFQIYFRKDVALQISIFPTINPEHKFILKTYIYIGTVPTNNTIHSFFYKHMT